MCLYIFEDHLKFLPVTSVLRSLFYESLWFDWLADAVFYFHFILFCLCMVQ